MCETTRPDWMSLPDLVQAWKRIRETKIAGGDVAARDRSFPADGADIAGPDAGRCREADRRREAEIRARTCRQEIGGHLATSATWNPRSASSCRTMWRAGVRSRWTCRRIWRKDRSSVRCSMVLRHEGGFVDHPADRGGPTNKGITQKTYRAYLRAKNPAITDADLQRAFAEGHHATIRSRRSTIRATGARRAASTMPNEALAAVIVRCCGQSWAQRRRSACCSKARGWRRLTAMAGGATGHAARLKAAAADSVGLIDGMLLARERFYRQIVQRRSRAGRVPARLDEPARGAQGLCRRRCWPARRRDRTPKAPCSTTRWTPCGLRAADAGLQRCCASRSREGGNG